MLAVVYKVLASSPIRWSPVLPCGRFGCRMTNSAQNISILTASIPFPLERPPTGKSSLYDSCRLQSLCRAWAPTALAFISAGSLLIGFSLSLPFGSEDAFYWLPTTRSRRLYPTSLRPAAQLEGLLIRVSASAAHSRLYFYSSWAVITHGCLSLSE